MPNPNLQLESVQPDGIQFFTPVSVGILLQLFCTGLVIAVTAALTLSAAPRAVTLASSDSSPTNAAREDSSEQPEPVAGGNDSATTNALNDTGASGTPAQPAASNAATPNTSQEPAGNSNVNTAANSSPPADGSEPTSNNGNTPALTTLTETAAVENAASDQAANDQTPNMSPAAETVVANGARALDDVRRKGRKLPLAGEGLSDEIEVCRIFAQDPAVVTMELIGGEFTIPEQMTLVLKPLPVTANAAVWKVAQESTTALSRDQEIGEFVLKDQQLRFRWFRNMDKGKLPFCRLRISVGPDSEVCDLWTVARSDAAKLRFTKSEQMLNEFVPTGIRLPPFDILELDLTFENWPEHELSSDKLTFNETVTVTFPDDESGKDLMTLKLSLDKKNGRFGLRGEYFLNAASLSSRRRDSEVRYDEKELTIDQLKKTFDSLESSEQKVEKELGGIKKSLEILNERLRQAVNGTNNVPQNVVDQLNAQIEEKENEESQQQDILDELRAAIEATSKAQSLCEEIAAKGQIQYRLFRPFTGDGGDVVIASTITGAAVIEESR
jgi:hypothetical protein